MAPQRHLQMGSSSVMGWQFGDTTYTKIFVGGLAWETRRDTLRRYFEQFGEILEAVVITDKNTGRSKGYGFVTFKEPEAAMRACVDPAPVIDGRRANCNLAAMGSSSNRPQVLSHQPEYGLFRPVVGSATAHAYHGSSATAAPGYFHPTAQYAYPNFYGYSGVYTQENMYANAMNYYSVNGGGQQNQFHPYYTAAAAAAATGPGAAGGVFPNFYSYHPQYTQGSSSHGSGGYGLQYPQLLQYPYYPQHYATSIISLSPASISAATSGVATAVTPVGPSSSLPPSTSAEQKPPS